MDAVRSTKMCVTFDAEFVVDFAVMLENIGDVYDISYAGISQGAPRTLFLQTSNYRVRMVAGKVPAFNARKHAPRWATSSSPSNVRLD